MLLTVGLVHQNNHRSFMSRGYSVRKGTGAKAHRLQLRGDLPILPGQLLGAIKNEQDDIGAFCCSAATLHADLLNGIIGWCNTGCINQMKGNTSQIGNLFYSITGCTSDWRDNSALATQ